MSYIILVFTLNIAKYILKICKYWQFKTKSGRYLQFKALHVQRNKYISKIYEYENSTLLVWNTTLSTLVQWAINDKKGLIKISRR